MLKKYDDKLIVTRKMPVTFVGFELRKYNEHNGKPPETFVGFERKTVSSRELSPFELEVVKLILKILPEAKDSEWEKWKKELCKLPPK